MRLIDADALQNRVDYCIKEGLGSIAYTFKHMIDEAPTIEIVRCKECKYWWPDGGALIICENTDMVTDPDDFCSYGERRKK